MLTEQPLTDDTSYGDRRQRERSARPTTQVRTLDAMFTRAARRGPARLAVHEELGHLTYGRAETLATQWASALVRSGVQLGDPVIVHCDDHRQSLVAQLAILKAGGVCVPVSREIERPGPERIAAVSGAQAVLCSASTKAAWNSCGRLSLALDDAGTWKKVSALRPDPALPRSAPTDAAYLLISRENGEETSGQLVDHRAWQFALAARIRQAGTAERTVAVCQPPTGALTLSAMWWACASGGTLVPRALAPGGMDTAVFSPDEYARVLETAATASRPAGLRAIVLVGGPFPPDLVERHFTTLPTTRLLAEFAPAGGVMPWTAQELSPPSRSGLPDAGVGSPVPHVHVHIVDPEGHPVPPGRTGEICATGPALPFDSIGIRALDRESLPGGGTLLRSGHLGRWRTDGRVEITA
ncbi:AMP-binding protein [Streptomyces xiangluensis]|uniref:AMP-binding protein n=1 Tax=Streptomyces xiangluensis TaxID=2665720 RepID=A0ABV8Z3E5_9ACTN